MRIRDPIPPQPPHEPSHRRRDKRRRRLRNLRRVPVLPSLVTLGNLFFGFLAMAKVADAVMLSASGKDFPVFNADVVAKLEAGAILIFVAMVFDALDGTIARLTKQTTKFGAQLDSLADVVTFGVAPAFLAKVLIEFHHQSPISLLPFHPKLYYVAAAVYVSCAALRLARFNVESSGPDEEDHKEFKGLPSPAAAAAICALVAFRCHIPWRPTSPPDAKVLQGAALPTNTTDPSYLLPAWFSDAVARALPFALVLVGLLMVSRLPYPHLMYQLVKKRHSFGMLLGILAIAGFAALEWQFALLLLILVYLASGFVIGAYRFATTGSLMRPKTAQIVRMPEDGSGTDER